MDAGKGAVLLSGNGAKTDIDGGVLLGRDAPVISGGEWYAEHGINISVQDAVLIAKSTTPGRLPCGIYQPQDGSTRLYGTEIYAEEGVGVFLWQGNLWVNDGSGSNGKATRIYAGGSGKGTVGSAEVEAGQRIVMLQVDGIPRWDLPVVNLSSGLQYQQELVPNAYPLDGYGVCVKDGRYSFGPICTIIFDPNGGVGGGTAVTGPDGKVTAMPANPTREGYVFRGWSESDNYGRLVDKNYVFDEDTTVSALWTPVGTHLICLRSSSSGAYYRVTDLNGVITDWPNTSGWSLSDGREFIGWFTEDGTAGREDRV